MHHKVDRNSNSSSTESTREPMVIHFVLILVVWNPPQEKNTYLGSEGGKGSCPIDALNISFRTSLYFWVGVICFTYGDHQIMF